MQPRWYCTVGPLWVVQRTYCVSLHGVLFSISALKYIFKLDIHNCDIFNVIFVVGFKARTQSYEK
jgi:hypothetical protein